MWQKGKVSSEINLSQFYTKGASIKHVDKAGGGCLTNYEIRLVNKTAL